MDATAILLCAGEGTRIREVTTRPKCLLPLAGKPIVQHQLEALGAAGIGEAVIVAGYQPDLVRGAVAALDCGVAIRFVDNAEYRTRGNSFSLLYGLQAAAGDVVVFDGDLIFAPDILARFLRRPENAFLVGPAGLDDAECAKALEDGAGYLRKLVDKRLLSEEELARYRFVGEAMGIIFLDNGLRRKLVEAADAFLASRENWARNWEHLFSRFLPDHEVRCRFTTDPRWIEIDTAEDYAAARALFEGGQGAALSA
jgi:choline kinase